VLVESGGPKAATAQVSPLPEVKLAPVALTAEFLAWHAALNFDHGAEYMAHLILGMNDDIRALARPAWRSPTYALIERQREIMHEPCRLLSCRGRCSRCIHAAAWAARGGRPYLGVQRERELRGAS